MRTTAFKNRSNTESYAILKNGSPFDLVAADITRIEVIAGGSTIDSTTENVSFLGSTITVKYGTIDISSGVYPVTIVAYTATDSEGFVLFGPGMDESIHLQLQE